MTDDENEVPVTMQPSETVTPGETAVTSSPVELLLRIRWRGAPADDLRIEAETRHTLAQLMAAAVETCGGGWEPGQPIYLERTAALLSPDSSLGACRLVSGDTIRFELYDVAADAVGPRGIRLDVLAGPEAGRSDALAAGVHVVGRASPSPLVIVDPTLAVRHVAIAVGDDLVTTVTPLPDIENPVIVNGTPVAGETTVGPTDIVQFGATAVALRAFAMAAEEGRDQLGQIPFNRTPHRPSVVADRVFKPLGGVPVRPEPRRFAVLTALLPLASGLLLFAFSKQVQFLALTALSPIALIGNWFEDRKSGRHRYASDVERFRERTADRVRDVRAGLSAERAERLAAAPDLADLARRAGLHTYDLWARSRVDEEFLTLRLGLGIVPSKVQSHLEDMGDRELREEAEAALLGFGVLPASPVSVNLRELGAVAVCGPMAEVGPLASALLVQVVTLHSPEDLVVVTIEGAAGSIAPWAKWLPHTRSATSPLGGPHVVDDHRSAERAVRELIEVAELRTAPGDRGDHRWPWILVVLDDAAGVDAALASQLLDLCPAAGISVLHLSSGESHAPRQARGVVRCLPPAGGQLSTVWFTDPKQPVQQFEPEPASGGLTDRVALALAPLRDATAATATTAIPRTVPLMTLFAQTPTAATISQEWLRDKPYALSAPIGTGADGPLVLDLVEHGPHALIGGTSGAGKSELLQSIVASLIAHYPPTRLNFLFVDYKGGASSTVFNDVPHTVGYVTNLEASLALRALTSLRAELNHRMRVLEGRAKDLAEMLEKYPQEAPPSLVIVVDEFATLVKEVPEFVAGIVDIAQRGRSLGIHLILATQRPSGSVNDNILANTNLRISLRMLDNSESTSVIGTTAAADIPVPLKGRAYARLGPRHLVGFQSAFTGAPYTQVTNTAPVRCERFGRPPRDGRRRATSAPAARGSLQSPVGPAHLLPVPALQGATLASVRTHLDVLLDAVRAALPGLAAPRRPWRDVLPELITLDAIAAEAAERGMPPSLQARNLVMAVADDPAAQDQYPASVDLEDGGGLLIVGGGGSGKTTAIRTVAVCAARSGSADEVAIYVIDCASRALRVVGDFPHTAAVATGDDLEGITRIIASLTAEVDRRRGVLSDLRVQAETLTAYLQSGHSMPRVLLLIDGYQTLAPMLGGLTADQTGLKDWSADLLRIVTDGRQVGIHTVLTVDRRQSVPPILMSAISNRLILRQTDEQGYTDFGIASSIAKGLDLPPGRAIRPDGLTVQLGVVGDRPDAASQSAAISAEAQQLTGTVAAELVTAPWPDTVTLAQLARLALGQPGGSSAPFSAVVGIADLTRSPVTIDVQFSDVMVVGQPRSGRSTALRTMAVSLAAAGADVWSIGLADSSGIAGTGRHCGPKADAAAALLEELLVMTETYPEVPRVLVVDNVDRYDDQVLFDVAGKVQHTDVVRIVGAIEMRNLNGYTMNPMLTELRHAARTLVLQPGSVGEVYAQLGVRPPLRPGLKMTPGRGVLLIDRIPTVVQVATA